MHYYYSLVYPASRRLVSTTYNSYYLLLGTIIIDPSSMPFLPLCMQHTPAAMSNASRSIVSPCRSVMLVITYLPALVSLASSFIFNASLRPRAPPAIGHGASGKISFNFVLADEIKERSERSPVMLHATRRSLVSGSLPDLHSILHAHIIYWYLRRQVIDCPGYF